MPTLFAVVLLISVTSTWYQNGCVAELYTALADMEELLETEAVLIDTLNGYIKAQEERLATLRKDDYQDTGIRGLNWTEMVETQRFSSLSSCLEYSPSIVTSLIEFVLGLWIMEFFLGLLFIGFCVSLLYDYVLYNSRWIEFLLDFRGVVSLATRLLEITIRTLALEDLIGQRWLKHSDFLVSRVVIEYSPSIVTSLIEFVLARGIKYESYSWKLSIKATSQQRLPSLTKSNPIPDSESCSPPRNTPKSSPQASPQPGSSLRQPQRLGELPTANIRAALTLAMAACLIKLSLPGLERLLIKRRLIFHWRISWGPAWIPWCKDILLVTELGLDVWCGFAVYCELMPGKISVSKEIGLDTVSRAAARLCIAISAMQLGKSCSDRPGSRSRSALHPRTTGLG
ncbi:hypothetical protein WN48_08784 [Eufriesea mexicana]|uniref:Uncharacterized protein n=1 Tax=Eufriesea mexicana TaxID=516756 RepID=A0A310SK56_9HYME|nr:hypothetical protein WN48_08784 [Eufriesea mexicana]